MAIRDRALLLSSNNFVLPDTTTQVLENIRRIFAEADAKFVDVLAQSRIKYEIDRASRARDQLSAANDTACVSVILPVVTSAL
jgi:hypothetical protein